MTDLFEWQELPKQPGAISKSKPRMPRMRNIRVTEKNASEVPIDWLHIRYHRLVRWLNESDKPKSEWELELSVIKEELDMRGRLELIQQQEAVQIELNMDTAVIHREEYVSIVEERLREYYCMNKELAWLRQLQSSSSDSLDYGYGNYLTSSYGHTSARSRTEYANPVEERVMRDYEQWEQRQARIQYLHKRMLPITSILQTRLTDEQRRLLEMKYLTKESPKDDYIMLKLHVGRQKYYNLKKQALQRIAYELGLI